MRIGIDGRELFGNPTGVGRYLTELIRRWARPPTCDAHEFIVYAPQVAPPPPGPIAPLLASGVGPVEVRRIPGAAGTWWEQVRLARVARGDRLDRFFAPAYSAPLFPPAPTVLTIHDLSFAAHPEWFGAREGLRRRVTVGLAARVADTILTDSEFSRAQILELLDVPASRVEVIPLGISPPERPSGGATPRRPPGPLVLFVGSIFNRRRVPDLIRAFARLTSAHPDLRLAIVGENRSRPHQDLVGLTATLGIADRVTVQAYVAEAALAELYARASVFVFLSEYEGFGLTPLEALAAGVPIVVLDTPVARERYGDAALFVAPGDLEGTARAIRALLVEPETRHDRLRSAGPVLARYSWDRTATQTLSAVVHTRPEPRMANP